MLIVLMLMVILMLVMLMVINAAGANEAVADTNAVFDIHADSADDNVNVNAKCTHGDAKVTGTMANMLLELLLLQSTLLLMLVM